MKGLLEKSLENYSKTLSHVNGDQNQYKTIVLLFGAASQQMLHQIKVQQFYASLLCQQAEDFLSNMSRL